MAILVITACGGSETPARENTAAPESGGTATAEGNAADSDPPAITADYLAGAWCYTHFVADDDQKDQNVTYIFKKDGTLLFQSEPMGAVDQPGTWNFDGERLRINPYFMFFNLKLKSKEQDQLVLDSMGHHFFQRGSCEG
jgi:hypothetical protein